MFNSHMWPRSSLSLREIIEVAGLFLTFAQSVSNQNALHLLCGNVSSILSAMKRGVRKTLDPSLFAEDQELCGNVAAIFTEHGRLWERLGNTEKARSSIEKAAKWSAMCNVSAHISRHTLSGGNSKFVRRMAPVPPEIFSRDACVKVFRPKLPMADARISSTPQLVYCIALLSKATLAPDIATAMDETLDEIERSWLQTMAEDADEQNRLRSLTGKLIAEFIDDDMKEPAAVVEVVSLAPVLTQTNYRKLLNHFIVSFEQAKLLEFGLLDGLAQLIQNAQGGHLLLADLVSILKALSSRLHITHQQSSMDLYALVRAVANVLDAMADCDVKGLNREDLHEPLSRYLDGLKDNSDLYLVYHAAYAYQALQYIPDDESPLQSVLRRARVMVSGISGVVSAVKGLDLNKFLDGLEDIQEGLTGAYQMAKAGFKGVAAAMEMVDSGAGLLDSLKEGLSFSHKCAWYPALRGSDAFIRNGELSKFKRLVCEAPCRRDAAFQLGVCQRLGEVAANPLWDNSTRQQAIDFLRELYENDAEWGQQASSKKWILTVLKRLSLVQNREIKEYALVVLKDLEKSGDGGRQKLYRAHLQEVSSSFPLEAAIQTPLTSPLLTRAQDIPNVEEDLRTLRKRQLKGRTEAVYIPPRAKASQQASNSASFDLMENMNEFLKSGSQVFLLLGDSGAGKSTFNRELECTLWTNYSSTEDAIPLFIHLPSIDRPEKDLVAKHLRRCDFSEPQIRELKNNRRFILICDGYDECQQIYNLYTNNNLNSTGQWQAKMIISCRSEHLGHDYKDRFQSSTNAATSSGVDCKQLQEAVIVPFSTVQIHDYIYRYVDVVNPPWRAKSYLTALERVPNLMDLIRNPFLLTLSLDVLPGFVDIDKIQDLSDVSITRVGLYDRFVEHWLERGKKRVGGQDLSQQARAAFDTLVDEGFTANGIDFLKRLAAAIYKEQAGHPIVEYSGFKDEETWKARFFSRKEESQLLREACPLARNGNQHRFVHKSLLEYCFTRAVFDPKISQPPLSGPSMNRRGSVSSMFSFDGEAAAEECQGTIRQAVLNNPLAWRSFVEEPSILQFLSERVQQEPSFKEQLVMMIENSKTDKDGRTAAANAITILIRAGIPFIGADLRGVRIPGADLSFGMFEGAQLQGADLRKVNFYNIWLRQADLSDSQMVGVRFGEWPYLQEGNTLKCFAYSPDGRSLAASLYDQSIVVYDTVTWTKTRTLHGHTSTVYSVAYSFDGQRIASGSDDKAVRLWDSRTGAIVLTIDVAHAVETVLFSPIGHQVASCSWDGAVRLWDTHTGALVLSFTDANMIFSFAYSPDGHQIALGCGDNIVRLRGVRTGAPGPVLTGHGPGSIRSIMFSPSGHQIATGGADKTVRLWDAQTGSLGLTLTGHSDSVNSVAYSPSGHQLASGNADKTVRLWDVQTGSPGPILTGHDDDVRKVSYSPGGHQIASASHDRTIRLWDAQTGTSSSVRGGSTSLVTCVAWSPSGTQIASGSDDHTVRLWNAQTGTSGPVLAGHTSFVYNVVYSPDGHHIASVSDDKTVRLWDAQTGAVEHILTRQFDSIFSAVYSPSGHQIVLAGTDEMLRAWDTQSGELRLALTGHKGFICSAVYSPNGQQLASGGKDKTVRLWNAQTGESGRVLRGHTGWIKSLVYSPSGHQLASVSWNEDVRLWDPQTGTLLSVLIGHCDCVKNVAYSPSGHQIASASNDKTVRVWDSESGACSLVLSGHTAEVRSLVFSSRGQRIASCSEDGTVRLWDVVSGDCLTSLSDVDKPITWLAWRDSDAGSFLATSNEGGTVRMWQEAETEGKTHFSLQWSSPHASMNAMGANIQNAHGLNRTQIRLLKQRGSVGKPTPPLSIRGAGEKLMSMTATVHRLSGVPKKELLEDLATEPSAGEIVPKMPPQEAELAVEE